MPKNADGNILRKLVQSNPHCQRLGNLPISLLEIVNQANFRQLPWSKARQQLAGLPLTKYCD